MDNDIVRKILWSGMTAAVAALTAVVAERVAGVIWTKVFKEDPPR